VRTSSVYVRPPASSYCSCPGLLLLLYRSSSISSFFPFSPRFRTRETCGGARSGHRGPDQTESCVKDKTGIAMTWIGLVVVVATNHACMHDPFWPKGRHPFTGVSPSLLVKRTCMLRNCVPGMARRSGGFDSFQYFFERFIFFQKKNSLFSLKKQKSIEKLEFSN
jgi:hypothetical protein